MVFLRKDTFIFLGTYKCCLFCLILPSGLSGICSFIFLDHIKATWDAHLKYYFKVLNSRNIFEKYSIYNSLTHFLLLYLLGTWLISSNRQQTLMGQNIGLFHLCSRKCIEHSRYLVNIFLNENHKYSRKNQGKETLNWQR